MPTTTNEPDSEVKPRHRARRSRDRARRWRAQDSYWRPSSAPARLQAPMPGGTTAQEARAAAGLWEFGQ
eukprot:4358816-Alexandrium_andersonii.AAC.1